MATCANIASGVLFTCPPPPPGVDASQLVLFNWDDIDFGASVVTKSQMSVLALKATKVGYIFEGINNSVRPSYESVTDGFNPFKYNHTVESRIFDDSGTISDIETDLSGGLFVAVYFTKSMLVKVAGFDVGLRAQVTRSYYDEEGAALITMVTPSDEFETTPALTFIGSGSPLPDFEANKATIIALT